MGLRGDIGSLNTQVQVLALSLLASDLGQDLLSAWAFSHEVELAKIATSQIIGRD